MVKGVTRRVVVIKSPDPEVFEQAIFIISDEAYKKGHGSTEILSQACKVAQRYIIKSKMPRVKRAVKPALFALAGAAATGAAWLIFSIV